MIAANKRSVITLFSSGSNIDCHQVRIVLAEKGVSYEMEEIVAGQINEDLMEINPYGTVPTLVDRELVLFNSRIIMEYLDERFPHPPLMPVYPVSRGQSRLLMFRIENDWYPVLAEAEKLEPQARFDKLAQLRDELLTLGPIFAQSNYFMSEEFSLIDCYLAPLLWRMSRYGIEFSGAGSKAIKAYMERVFARDSFIKSLGDDALTIFGK